MAALDMLDTAIHAFSALQQSWISGSSPVMTNVISPERMPWIEAGHDWR